MAVVATKVFADRALDGRNPVPAFNVFNHLTREAVQAAAEELRSPLIVQTSMKTVDDRVLTLMKPTAFLINTARGRFVDQAALTHALEEGRIAGAGLDVFEQEPPNPSDPLFTREDVILTPHALAWTDELAAGNGAGDVEAVLAVMHGREPRNIVNRAVLESPLWLDRLTFLRDRFGDGRRSEGFDFSKEVGGHAKLRAHAAASG